MIPAPPGGGLAARARVDAGAAIDCIRKRAPRDAGGARQAGTKSRGCARARRAAFLPTKRPAPGAARPAKRSSAGIGPPGGAQAGRPCAKPLQRHGGFSKFAPASAFSLPGGARRGHARTGAARGKGYRIAGAGARPFRTASTRSRSARPAGLFPLRCPPPLRMCRRPAQGAAWRSCRARRTPPAACRPCPWRIADSGAASPPPSALPAPSRPRRAGLFARRRAPDARPFLRPRTRALPGTL